MGGQDLDQNHSEQGSVSLCVTLLIKTAPPAVIGTSANNSLLKRGACIFFTKSVEWGNLMHIFGINTLLCGVGGREIFFLWLQIQKLLVSSKHLKIHEVEANREGRVLGRGKSLTFIQLLLLPFSWCFFSAIVPRYMLALYIRLPWRKRPSSFLFSPFFSEMYTTTHSYFREHVNSRLILPSPGTMYYRGGRDAIQWLNKLPKCIDSYQACCNFGFPQCSFEMNTWWWSRACDKIEKNDLERSTCILLFLCISVYQFCILLNFPNSPNALCFWKYNLNKIKDREDSER